MDNRIFRNVKTGLLISFIVVPIILILLFIYLFTISMDSIITSLTNSFSDFLSKIMTLIFINIFLWGGTTLLFNNITHGNKKQCQLQDILLCIFWILEIVILGVFALTFFFIFNQQMPVLLHSYCISYFLYAILSCILLILKIIYHIIHYNIYSNNQDDNIE